jgi:hypothetical protein
VCSRRLGVARRRNEPLYAGVEAGLEPCTWRLGLLVDVTSPSTQEWRPVVEDLYLNCRTGSG